MLSHRVPPLRRTAIALAVALLLGACGGGDDDDASAPTPTTTTTEAAGTGSGEGGAGEAGTEVELLEAGAEPRRALRLAPAVGPAPGIVVEMRMNTETEVDGEEAVPPIPMTLRMPMTVEVTHASDDGFTVGVEYGAAELADTDGLDPSLAGELRGVLDGLAGTSATMEMTSRGFVTGGAVEAPEGTDPAFTQQFTQLDRQLEELAAPLPEEAVGVGARWRARQEVDSDGLALVQVSTYELVNLDDDRYVLRVETDQQLGDGGATDEGFEVRSWEMTGTGEVEGDLALVFPTRSTNQVSGGSTMVLTMGDEESELVQRLSMETSVTHTP